MSYLDLTLEDLHSAIVTGKVLPEDLVKEALNRCKNDNHNAFEYICENEALAAVKNLDFSKKDSIFFGVPVVVKDNFSTKDIPTTGSSNILNGYIPIFDSEVVTRLKNAGAIIIAKTTLDELAMGGSGTTGHKGTSSNPWNEKYQIGGSSCGSAISVCSGIVPFALGSDTGDSVRKPASFGGMVGLKPTWGRISRFGLFPFAVSLDHVGFFTRSVNDSALSLNVLAGRDDKDSTSSFVKVDNYIENIDDSIKGKKIAVIKGVIDSISDSVVKTAFEKSVDALRKHGAIVENVDLDENLLLAIYPTYIIISCAEATSNNSNLDGIKFGARQPGNTYEEIIINTRTKGFSELIKRRFVIGSYSLLKENRNELFNRAQKCRRLIVDAVNSIYKNYDAIYLPAAPGIAPILGQASGDKLSEEYLIADNWMAIGNFGGYPSITLPIGFENGLPLGANLMCRPYEEKLLFNIAKKIEDSTGLKNIIAKEGK